MSGHHFEDGSPFPLSDEFSSLSPSRGLVWVGMKEVEGDWVRAPELGADLAVAHTTVRHSLEDLERHGLAESRPALKFGGKVWRALEPDEEGDYE